MWLHSVCLMHPRLRAVGMRTGVALSYLTLRSDALATSTIVTRSLRLCAFRGRSRHTSGFEPYNTFELPPQEIRSALGENVVRLQPTQGSDVFQWIETSVGDEELTEAAARCVLLHGVFEVWGHGATQEEAALDASTSGRFPEHFADASWSLGVTSYGRSNLSKAQEQTLAGGHVGSFLSTFLQGTRTEPSASDIRVRIIEDRCPPPPGNLPRQVQKTSGAAALKSENRFYICRELQAGAATGGGTAMGTSCRRPVRGVLSALALNARRCRGSTAIEPEVALVMANLAKVRPGSLVLDPFCGSCSLLLPAANMGAITWGSDVSGPATVVAPAAPGEEASIALGEGQHGDMERKESGRGQALQADREGLEGIREDFGALGLVPPTLVAADVADEESLVRRAQFYDAIITDPPYNIKEKVVVNNDTDTINRSSNSSSSSSSSSSCSSRVAQEGSNSTFVGHADEPSPQARGSSMPGLPDDNRIGYREQLEMDDSLRRIDTHRMSARPSVTSTSDSSEWVAGGGGRAVAYANSLVGDVVWSLLSLARHSLKPGGRLSFFLPLRGAEARLAELPAALVGRLGERDAHGERLRVVYASKQRMTSANMCRWLVVLEKHCNEKMV